jgi:hypothetical protein
MNSCDTKTTFHDARASLTARLWRTAELQAAEIEARLGSSQRLAVDSERDARVLSVLAKTLRELSSASLITEEADRNENDATPDDLEALREALGEKLRKITAERTRQSITTRHNPESGIR